MKWIQILSFLLITFLLLYFLKKDKNVIKISKRKTLVISICLGLLFLFLLFYKLDNVPYGLHADEAGMAYDAYSLSKYGVDRYLYTNPVYFINFGGGQNALYTHLTSLLLRVLPYSIFTIRLPAVLLSLLACLVFFLFIKKELGTLPGIIMLGLFCVLPFSIMHSRWALESYLLFPMLVISVCTMMYAIKNKKDIWFFVSGILFGITLYTYAISYLILPIFLAIVLLKCLVQKEISWKHLFEFGIPLFFLALPLILMLAINNGFISEIKTPLFSIPKLWFYRGGEFSLLNIPKNLNILKILFIGDGLKYNSFAKFGTLYGVSLPFLLYGMYVSFKKVKNEKSFSDFVFITLFIVTFFISLILNKPNINRVNAIFVPIFYFLTLGIYEFIQKKKYLWMIVLGLYVLTFIPFLNYYFNSYPKENKNSYYFVTQNKLEEALSYAKSLTDHTIYVIEDNQPYIYTILYEKMSPFEFHDQATIDGLVVTKVGRYAFQLAEKKEDDSVYIFIKQYMIPEDMNEENYVITYFDDIAVYQRKESKL